MATITNFPILICGDLDAQAAKKMVIPIFLERELVKLSTEIAELNEKSDSVIHLYGPFLGRAFLEVSLTVLIGRLDPFRLLALREVQRHRDYELGVKVASAVHWTGDIIPSKTVSDCWSPEKPLSDIRRALLGEYYDDLFWKKGFIQALDAIPDGNGGEWLKKLRLIEPNRFVPRIKSELNRVYSSLSKGIHHEFVIPPEALYDRTAILTLLNDGLQWVSALALVSHFIENCWFNLTPQRAAELYETLQDT